MDSNRSSLAAVTPATELIFTRAFQSFKCWRKLRGCQSCKDFAHRNIHQFNINQLETSAARGCHACALFLDAVQNYVPSSMFSKSHSIVLQGTRTRPSELNWWYSSSDRTEGNPVHDLRLGIDLFTTKGARILAALHSPCLLSYAHN
jgi:hypothetical protein